MKRDFTGKVAVVTGAGGQRGIGRATAVRLAREGADIALIDIPWVPTPSSSDPQQEWRGVHSVCEEIQALGRKALAFEASVSSEHEVQEAVRQTLDAFGRIDFLVVNAAARPAGDRVPVVELPEAELRRVLDVNLIGSFLCCKAVGAHLQQQERGAVVIVASQSARIGKARFGAYAASKFGQLGLMQAFAHEMGPHNVRVNAVCPGVIDTARIDFAVQAGSAPGAIDDSGRNRVLAEQQRHIPLGRVGMPDDVAATIAFLCSDDARHITGQSIGVDGGSRM